MNRTDSRHENNRRQFLYSLAAMGTGALLPVRAVAQGRGRGAGEPAGARANVTNARRIDVHHHFVPPTWLTAAPKPGLVPDTVAKWKPADSIEQIDRCGTQTAMLSPGQFIWRYADQRMKLQVSGARAANEFGARMVADYPGRFGLFAALPLPDVDATLKEIAYAMDTLKAAGISVSSNFGDKYLGDPMFVPVLEELNRRKAIVHSNPFMPPCCLDMLPGLSPSPIEYVTDQTRMTISLVINKVPAKYPGIRFILAQTGGTALAMLGRFDAASASTAQNLEKPASADSVLAALRSFYYDVSGSGDYLAMYTAKKVVGAERLLFGTDFQAQGADQGVRIVEGLVGSGVFTDAELKMIDRENALKLFPQLART
jgi:predicted TIM-barrel fold metal-dependent hydrolase